MQEGCREEAQRAQASGSGHAFEVEAGWESGFSIGKENVRWPLGVRQVCLRPACSHSPHLLFPWGFTCEKSILMFYGPG